MKKTLKQIKGISLLKRNEKLHANCSYILNSESVAMNTYFEKKRDVIRVHQMFEKHLSPFMDILNYLITPNGWMLLITTKTEDEILKGVNQKRYDSMKMKRAKRRKDISVILSESIRYAIAGTVTRHNDKNERQGTLVSRNFSRFIFENLESAQEIMKKMKDEQICLCWQKKRYKPSLEKYNTDGELAEKGDVFLCTKDYNGNLKKGGVMQYRIVIISKSIHVLRQTIEHAKSIYLYKETNNLTYLTPIQT